MKNLCNSFAAIAIVTAAMGGLAADSADAATIRGRFTTSNSQNTSITLGSSTRNVNAVKFNWTRTDVTRPGVDATIADQFTTYCVELNQSVSGGNEYLFDVLTPAQAGWTEQQTLAVQVLWADRFADTVTTSGSTAFQLAMWELTHDTGMDLDSGNFRSGGAAGAKSLAQNWLSALGTMTPRSGLPEVVILRSPTAQDQVTVLVPAPGAAACAMLGLTLLGSRRRR
jgi:hypothetical protein